jgi:DHA1 family bicyclomycin/chloramphenicol resistance-like MFS transporter
MFSWVALSPYVLIVIYHISPANFGWWFGANAVGFIGMSQVNAHLLRWHTPEAVLVKARLASVAFAAVLLVDAVTGFGGMLGVMLPLYATLGSFGFVGPNTQAAAMNVDPRRTGSISSILGASTFTVGTLISAVGGYLHDGTARPLAILVLVLILASSAALYAVAKPLRPQPAG